MGYRYLALTCSLLMVAGGTQLAAALSEPAIPLPEHPRPDFQRPTWLNLNGPWRFQFDPQNQGLNDHWSTTSDSFAQTISVPFPWGSTLSGVEDSADIGWYARSITVPQSWQGQRVFLVVGASDWHTTAWLDGHRLGEHQGGYTPFAFDLTPHVQYRLAAATGAPRRRHAASVQIGRQTGLRACGWDLANGVSGTAAGRRVGDGAFHSRRGRRPGRRRRGVWTARHRAT